MVTGPRFLTFENLCRSEGLLQNFTDMLGCGTVRVELKLRFTGYRPRFTVLGYGSKNTFASEVFKFLHQKSLLWCFQSTHVSCPKIAFEGTPSTNYSVKINYFERIRLLKTFLFENEQLNSLQNFHKHCC